MEVCTRQKTGRAGKRGSLLFPVAVLCMVLAGCGITRSLVGVGQPLRDCGIRCIKHVATLEGWNDDVLAPLESLRHAHEDRRGYSALELVSILRRLGIEAHMEDGLEEADVWRRVQDGERLMLLIQDDWHARAFPLELHWVVLNHAEPERYRVFLADRNNRNRWIDRNRIERYHERSKGTVVVVGPSRVSEQAIRTP